MQKQRLHSVFQGENYIFLYFLLEKWLVRRISHPAALAKFTEFSYAIKYCIKIYRNSLEIDIFLVPEYVILNCIL